MAANVALSQALAYARDLKNLYEVSRVREEETEAGPKGRVMDQRVEVVALALQGQGSTIRPEVPAVWPQRDRPGLAPVPGEPAREAVLSVEIHVAGVGLLSAGLPASWSAVPREWLYLMFDGASGTAAAWAMHVLCEKWETSGSLKLSGEVSVKK